MNLLEPDPNPCNQIVSPNHTKGCPTSLVSGVLIQTHYIKSELVISLEASPRIQPGVPIQTPCIQLVFPSSPMASPRIYLGKLPIQTHSNKSRFLISPNMAPII